MGAQGGGGQWRIPAADQQKIQVRDLVLELKRDEIVNGPVADQMVVVQHQRERFLDIVQGAVQLFRQNSGLGQIPGAEPGGQPGAGFWRNRLNRRHKVGQKYSHVTIGLFQREPGGRESAFFQPVADQRAFPVSGGSNHQTQRKVFPFFQPVEQHRTRHNILCDRRAVQFGLYNWNRLFLFWHTIEIVRGY